MLDCDKCQRSRTGRALVWVRVGVRGGGGEGWSAADSARDRGGGRCVARVRISRSCSSGAARVELRGEAAAARHRLCCRLSPHAPPRTQPPLSTLWCTALSSSSSSTLTITTPRSQPRGERGVVWPHRSVGLSGGGSGGSEHRQLRVDVAHLGVQILEVKPLLVYLSLELALLCE